MPVKKGLSLEEKRTRAMDYLQATKDVFQLKDLEKLLPKHKGITVQTVKEVVQSLVDDRLISSEKIGTSNYFWSFPSMAQKLRTNQVDAVTAKLSAQRELNGRLHSQLQELKAKNAGVDPTSLAQYAMLKGEVSELAQEIESYRETNPQVFAERQAQLKLDEARSAAYTDCLCALEDYCHRQLGIERAQFRQMFELSEELLE